MFKRIFFPQYRWYDRRIKQIIPFKPEFTIVIFIHYKPRIDSRLVVDEDDLMLFKK